MFYIFYTKQWAIKKPGSLLDCSIGFYLAAWNADAVYSDENSLSVCASVKRVDCDKTEERSVQVFIPYERSFSLVFLEEEWLVAGDPFYRKFRVNSLERNR